MSTNKQTHRTWRQHMVARGLRTRRDNSPAFRRSDLAKRATALRKRYERYGAAWMECGSVERAAMNYARAQRWMRLAARLMFPETRQSRRQTNQ